MTSHFECFFKLEQLTEVLGSVDIYIPILKKPACNRVEKTGLIQLLNGFKAGTRLSGNYKL